jgi:hypothetical protein
VRRVAEEKQEKPMDTDGLASGNDLKRKGMQATVVAETETVPGQAALKQGVFGKHTVYSDEGEDYGGHDVAPPPLGYAALALGW